MVADCLTSDVTQDLCITAYEWDSVAVCWRDDSAFIPIFEACLFNACAACFFVGSVIYVDYFTPTSF